MEQAAKRAQYSLTTMFRIENGHRHVSPADVATLCVVYGLPSKERQELVEATENPDGTGLWDRALPGVPSDIGTLASFEADAVDITDWSINLIPGLLQTYEYAVGLMRSAHEGIADIEVRWMARQRRQKILGTVDYTAFIGEAALRTPFGGREALRGQLRHLLTARERGIGVRVLPEHTPHALLTHSWKLMEFAESKPVLYVEAWTGALYLHHDVAESYLSVRDKLARAALSVEGSQAILRKWLLEV